MSRFISLSLKIAKWVAIVMGSLVLLLLISVEVFDRYLASDKGARWLFDDIKGQPVHIHRTTSGVRYVEIGDPDKKPLLLIHGAPGSLFDWKSFAKKEGIYEHYRLLIVERPGYGDTQPRKAEKSVKVQAERIAEVLAGETQAATILGHSYGGPLAVLVGAVAPRKNWIVLSLFPGNMIRIMKLLSPFPIGSISRSSSTYCQGGSGSRM